jgi:hypothetical protein
VDKRSSVVKNAGRLSTNSLTSLAPKLHVRCRASIAPETRNHSGLGRGAEAGPPGKPAALAIEANFRVSRPTVRLAERKQDWVNQAGREVGPAIHLPSVEGALVTHHWAVQTPLLL